MHLLTIIAVFLAALLFAAVAGAEPGPPPHVMDPLAMPMDDLPEIDPATLLRDLSPWGMFRDADRIVQAVMVGLVVASVLTWTVALAKALELAGAKRRAARGLALLEAARSLPEAARKVGRTHGVAVGLLAAAAAELDASGGDAPEAGVLGRVASRLDRIEVAAGRAVAVGTGVLATVGAIAPFVGLFGTVWGIMNSFIGISEAQTTNLAVVAPGIAEALLATALGLVAAIPAVILYNLFARSIAGYRALVGDAAAAVLRLVGRDLERRGTPLAQAAE